ncbi:MAG: aminoglycoside phosphotransferase family protein [Trueperaceae bacterium]|nr:aminoglycoside phosphotransferase family protein [Trueperaceae bacterium]
MSAIKELSLEHARAFLLNYYQQDQLEVFPAGRGAWSQCFAFSYQGKELVIRFGQHLDDFLKDRLASQYSGQALPIPEVLDIGKTDGGFYAISARAFGSPLEKLGRHDWLKTLPSLISCLEALRFADLSGSTGYGSWRETGEGTRASWSEHLLRVNLDTPAQRTQGWRSKLAKHAFADETFTWAYSLLQERVDDAIPRSLVHADLINRNVLVKDHQISGVFDWGCALYGDHLYDLAWLEFWAPWYPEHDLALLKSALEQSWRNGNYFPTNYQNRLDVCYLHIGLDHLAYNAHLENWSDLEATAKRMRHLLSPV